MVDTLYKDLKPEVKKAVDEQTKEMIASGEYNSNGLKKITEEEFVTKRTDDNAKYSDKQIQNAQEAYDKAHANDKQVDAADQAREEGKKLHDAKCLAENASKYGDAAKKAANGDLVGGALSAFKGFGQKPKDKDCQPQR